MGGHTGSTYLDTYTEEKVCFVASAAFWTLARDILVVVKTLCGPCTSHDMKNTERFGDKRREIHPEVDSPGHSPQLHRKVLGQLSLLRKKTL